MSQINEQLILNHLNNDSTLVNGNSTSNLPNYKKDEIKKRVVKILKGQNITTDSDSNYTTKRDKIIQQTIDLIDEFELKF